MQKVLSEVNSVSFSSRDKGGRRSGIDRRQFSYFEYIPERRQGEDRRAGIDRRNGDDRRDVAVSEIKPNRRCGMDRREAY
ncbi:hypothetical protein ACFL9T_10195 [Thermodesulfobacteriota bacterium]